MFIDLFLPDVFSIQSSNFKYVLDLLDGESKDTDTTDSTIVTASRQAPAVANGCFGSNGMEYCRKYDFSFPGWIQKLQTYNLEVQTLWTRWQIPW